MVVRTGLAAPADAGAPNSESLMPLLSEPYLRQALRQSDQCVSEPGADGMTWAQLRRDADVLLPRLAQQLAENTWQPGSMREVCVPTYTGKQMQTAVPPVVDRLVHLALRNAIEPVLDKQAFHPWVSGFRPRRNRISALRLAAAYRHAGYRWVADLEVASVWEGATVEEVIDWHSMHIRDDSFLSRLRVALTALPNPITLGSNLASMLINLRLSQVDRLVAPLRIVRFACNYAGFTSTRGQVQEAFYAISDALLPHRLYPNETKSRIRSDVNVEDLFLIGG